MSNIVWYKLGVSTPCMQGLPENVVQPLVSKIKNALIPIITEDTIFKLKLSLKENFKIRSFFQSNMDKEDDFYEVSLDGGCLVSIYPKGWGIENVIRPEDQAKELVNKIAKTLWELLERKSNILVNIYYSEEDKKRINNSEKPLSVDYLENGSVSKFLEKE